MRVLHPKRPIRLLLAARLRENTRSMRDDWLSSYGFARGLDRLTGSCDRGRRIWMCWHLLLKSAKACSRQVGEFQRSNDSVLEKKTPRGLPMAFFML